MKIKKGFMLRKVAQDNVVIPIGAASANLNGIIRLNEAGALLWQKLIAKDATAEELAEVLMQEYGISKEQAEGDVQAFLKMLEPAKCIEL